MHLFCLACAENREDFVCAHIAGRLVLEGRFWRNDLPKLNPKYHMNYSIIFTETTFNSPILVSGA